MKHIEVRTEKTPLIGAVLAGFLASACCIGPLIVVLLGLGSASAFIALEPYRPLFAVLTLALLAWAGWKYWQGKQQCIVNGCQPKKPLALFALGGVSVLLLVSPSWLAFFIT
ncbi:MAG: mercuric transporter MerT family protein [Mariprofundus sp.]